MTDTTDCECGRRLESNHGGTVQIALACQQKTFWWFGRNDPRDQQGARSRFRASHFFKISRKIATRQSSTTTRREDTVAWRHPSIHRISSSISSLAPLFLFSRVVVDSSWLHPVPQVPSSCPRLDLPRSSRSCLETLCCLAIRPSPINRCSLRFPVSRLL